MTKEQKSLVITTMNQYINTVNSLVSVATNGTSISKYTTADVNASLPSALTNQCIRDAKSIVNKYNKYCRKVSAKNKKLAKQKSNITIKEPTVPVLKRPCCYVNNQNFKIKNNHIEFPVLINDKSKRISIRTSMTDNQKLIFANAKLGTMRIVYKGNKIVLKLYMRLLNLNILTMAMLWVLTLVLSVLRYRIHLMAMLSSMAMAVKINICAGIINIFARN